MPYAKKGMNKKKGMHKKVTGPAVLAKKKGMYKKGKKKK